MMRAAVVVGTRPEAIKLAPVILELRRQGHEARVILTGQHGDLCREALADFGIRKFRQLREHVPDSPFNMARRVGITLERLGEGAGKIFDGCSWVVCQGDTASAFAAAVAGFTLGIPVAHVEAGLRTHHRLPWPEEGFRQMIARVADLHFAPTEGAERNLLDEKIPLSKIRLVGNTVIDAQRLIRPAPVPGIAPGFVLVTSHRRENAGRIVDIVRGVDMAVGESRAVVTICHPNWKTGWGEAWRNISGSGWVLDPVRYPAMQWLLRNAVCVVTDSGGLQEECIAAAVPCVVTRETTERPEGIESGMAVCAGTDPGKIRRAVLAALDRPVENKSFFNPYGDGHAAERIVEALAAAAS